MKSTSTLVWNQKLTDISKERMEKPRIRGLTMVMDKGLGLTAYQDLLQLAGEYIDFIKLGFGTAGLTPIPLLQEKMAAAKQHQIHLYPGGTFFEVAFYQDCLESYFQTLKELEFTWVEVSDGTIQLSPSEREQVIALARSYGFRIITEIGKKTAGAVTSIPDLLDTYHHDLGSGASYVIVEGRESGENIGIYDEEGKVNQRYVAEVLDEVDPHRIIWEAPQKKQQVQLLKLAGCHVNLGNISPQEILAVESLRRGLRSDTFLNWYTQELSSY